MENTTLKFLMGCLCILGPQTIIDVLGQCSKGFPKNLAVYEGTQNISMMCNSPNKTSWTFKPTTDELIYRKITNYDDVVNPTFANHFAVDSSKLIIKIGQGLARVPPESTAALYTISLNGSAPTFGAKLVVVLQPPTCACININATGINLTCTLIYANSSYNPINAKMTWTTNGSPYLVDIPVRTLSGGYWTSTSVITVDAYMPYNYDCVVNFAKPTSITFAFVAANAPVFSATCTPPYCGYTTTPEPTTTATTSTTTTITTTTEPTTTVTMTTIQLPATTTTTTTTTEPKTTTTASVTTTSGPECVSNVMNIAVKAGQTNTLMSLYNNPQNVSWKVIPTSDESSANPIIDYGGTRDPTTTSLYDVNQTGLVIQTATTDPISTAGLYIGQCANNRTGAKLVVVQSGPLCSCSPTYYGSSLSCNVTYADSSLHPVYAIVTWKLNGAFLQSNTLSTRTRMNNLFFSQSAIANSAGNIGVYTCELSFEAPTDSSFPFVATNAPVYNDSCSIQDCGYTTTPEATTTAFETTTQPPDTTTTTTTTTEPTTMTLPPTTTTTTASETTTTSPSATSSTTSSTATATPVTIKSGVGQCTTPPINQVVYEGTENTSMTCNSPLPVSWTVYPTNDKQHLFHKKISNFSDTVEPSLISLYDITQTNLNIKIAQSTPAVAPIATSGLYVAQYGISSATKIGAKLVAVRDPPTCNCTAINSTSNSITCSIAYADSTYNPIYAVVTWTADSVLYSTDVLNVRTKGVDGSFTSTSTITTSVNDPRTFQCTVQFTNPKTISIAYIATNAPAFSATCMPNCAQAQCSTPPINLAVYEGAQNTMMTCNSPTKVSYIIKPTTNELANYNITNYDDSVDPSLQDLFDVNPAGLIIKVAKGTAPVAPISTAGLYLIQHLNSTSRVGAKFLVIRQPPTCNCKVINSTKISKSCNITYGDSSYHPIDATMTWTSNGNFYRKDTPERIRVFPNWESTSTITVDASDQSTFQCKVTFEKPSEIQFPYIATNAPEFSATCTSIFCGNPTPSTPTSTNIPITTSFPKSTTEPANVTLSTSTSRPTTTTFPKSTSEPTTATHPPTTAIPSTTECQCAQTTACPSLEQNCTKTRECQLGGTDLTRLYDECVVKAELYARCDNCCPDDLVCGVVVTLRNDSRWLIHDPLCDDNKCQMVVFDASCMSSDWKLLAERKVIVSGVGDYVKAGNSYVAGLGITDCSESCKRMMNLL